MSTTENTPNTDSYVAEFIYKGVKHRRLLGVWQMWSPIGNRWEDVSFDQEGIVQHAYMVEHPETADSASPQDSTEIKPDAAEQQPATVEAPALGWTDSDDYDTGLLDMATVEAEPVTEVHELEGPQTITVPLLFPVVSVPSKTCKVCGNEADNGIICDDCKNKPGDPKPVASETVVSLEQPQDIFTDAHTTESLAEALELISAQAKKLEELAAENTRLTHACKDREDHISALVCGSVNAAQDNLDMEKQIDNLSNRRVRMLRKAAKTRKVAEQARAQVREQKAAIKALTAGLEFQNAKITELTESLAAARAHIELLQRQTSVAGIIETRQEPDSPKA